jgi:hypothetical protein
LDESKFFEPITILVSGIKKDKIKSVVLVGKQDDILEYVYDEKQNVLLINSLPYSTKIKVQLKP